MFISAGQLGSRSAPHPELSSSGSGRHHSFSVGKYNPLHPLAGPEHPIPLIFREKWKQNGKGKGLQMKPYAPHAFINQSSSYLHFSPQPSLPRKAVPSSAWQNFSLLIDVGISPVIKDVLIEGPCFILAISSSNSVPSIPLSLSL